METGIDRWRKVPPRALRRSRRQQAIVPVRSSGYKVGEAPLPSSVPRPVSVGARTGGPYSGGSRWTAILLSPSEGPRRGRFAVRRGFFKPDRAADRKTLLLQVAAVDGPVSGKPVAPPRRAFGIVREIVNGRASTGIDERLWIAVHPGEDVEALRAVPDATAWSAGAVSARLQRVNPGAGSRLIAAPQSRVRRPLRSAPIRQGRAAVLPGRRHKASRG